MKKNLTIFATLFLLTSCVSNQIGMVSTSFSDKPLTYEDIAVGISQTNYYFGFGGLNQDALVLEAKRELIKNRPLRNNEEYKNFTVDFKTTYWPFYTQKKVIMSADVVRFAGDTVSTVYSSNYSKKLIGGINAHSLFEVGDTVFDSKLNRFVIVSFVKDDVVMVLFKTKSDKIKTKRLSVCEIYSGTKSFNGHKAGGLYALNYYKRGQDYDMVLPIVGVGSKYVLLKSEKNKIFTAKNK